MLSLWIIVFIASLFALVKGADWFLGSAEKIGRSFGLSPFVVGVLIVGVGTSLPELVAGVSAVLQGVRDVAVATAVGSNISNILLIIGISAVITKKIVVDKDLIDSELPMLSVATAVFLVTAYDGIITFTESVFLVVAYLIYLFYTFDGEGDETNDTLHLLAQTKPEVKASDYLRLFLGMAILVFGAKYIISSVVSLSEILNIAPGLISLTAIALGTSLPELIVSVKAAKEKAYDVAVGNIFGSNAFNALMVTGIPGLLAGASSLHADEKTLSVGLPIMALATFLFIISGISRRIYKWEGMMYILLYFFFLAKLFGAA